MYDDLIKKSFSVFAFLVLWDVIYFLKNPCMGDTESLHKFVKKIICHLSRVLYHVSHVMTLFCEHFLAFVVILTMFVV